MFYQCKVKKIIFELVMSVSTVHRQFYQQSPKQPPKNLIFPVFQEGLTIAQPLSYSSIQCDTPSQKDFTSKLY